MKEGHYQNYMINFNSSQVPTPNERSFADLAETTK